MSERPRIEDLDLSDSELVTLLKNHGIARRSLLKAAGVGTLAAAGAGRAAAHHRDGHSRGSDGPQGNARIDPYYGYSSPEDQDLTGTDLEPDHEVGLHIHEHAIFSPTRWDVPFHFSPTGLKIDEGDVVRFNVDTPEHTITAYHEGQGREQRVPNDVPPFSSPVINGGGFWLYEFDSPGTYDVFCAPHELFGMVMRIVVGDPDDTAYDGAFEMTGRPPVSRAEMSLLGVTEFPFPTPNAVLQTEALSVDNIASNGSVGFSAVQSDLEDLPIVTKLIPMEQGGSSSDAEFDIQWEVSDVGTNQLDSLNLALIDVAEGPPPEDADSPSVSGQSASGTTRLVASGDEDSERQYAVQATVVDTAGNTSSSTVPVSEDPTI